MIEQISHITFIVKDLERTARLYKVLFDAQEVYDSGEQLHSIAKEKFFLISGLWIAIMESDNIINRTYHHIAFKIAEEDFPVYLEKIKALKLEFLPSRPRISGEGRSLYFYDYDNNLFELHTGTLAGRLAAYEKVDRNEE